MILLVLSTDVLTGEAFAQNSGQAQRRSDIFITDYISELNLQAERQYEKIPKTNKESLCPPNQVMNIDGSCSDADVTQNIFVYGSPSEEEEYLKEKQLNKPKVPRPKIEYNVVVIQKDETKEEPIIIPPPKEKTIVLVLKEEAKDKKRKIIKVPSQNPQPEVLFIDYKEGENVQLPFGFDLNTVLSSSSNVPKESALSSYGLEDGKKINPWTSSPPFKEYEKTFGGSYGLPKFKKEISIDGGKNSSKEKEDLFDLDSLLKNHRIPSSPANVSDNIEGTNKTNKTSAPSIKEKSSKPREFLQPFVLEYSESKYLTNFRKNDESQNKTSGNQTNENESIASKKPAKVDFSLHSLEQIQKTLASTLKEFINEGSSSTESYNQTQKSSSTEANELQNNSVSSPLSNRESFTTQMKDLSKSQEFYTQDLPLKFFKTIRSGGTKPTLQRANKDISKSFQRPIRDSDFFPISKEKPTETNKQVGVYQRPTGQLNKKSFKTKNIPNKFYQRPHQMLQSNLLNMHPQYINKNKAKRLQNKTQKDESNIPRRKNQYGIHSRNDKLKITHHSSSEQELSQTKIRLSQQLRDNMKAALLESKVSPLSLLTASYYKNKKSNSIVNNRTIGKRHSNDNMRKTKHIGGFSNNENLSFIPSGRIISLGSESHPVGWRRVDENKKKTLGNPQRKAIKRASLSPLLRLPSFHYTKR